jgi:hypothetical protein
MAKVQEIKESPTESELIPTNLVEVKAACKRVGLSLEKSLKVILAAQEANKTTVDKFGDEHIEPDHDKRLKGAVMHLELERYIVKNDTINNNVNFNLTLKQKEEKEALDNYVDVEAIEVK